MYGNPVLPRCREFWVWVGKDHWAKTVAEFEAYELQQAAALGITIEERRARLAQEFKVIVDPNADPDPDDYGV